MLVRGVALFYMITNLCNISGLTEGSWILIYVFYFNMLNTRCQVAPGKVHCILVRE